jgi:hypothetical protein
VVLGGCQRLTRALEGNAAVYAGNRRGHAVGSRVPQPGGARHPGLVTARPPAARHLDGLHPLSPLAATVFIRGFFDRYDRVRAVQMRRLGCAAIRGGCLVVMAVSFFRAWRLGAG